MASLSTRRTVTTVGRRWRRPAPPAGSGGLPAALVVCLLALLVVACTGTDDRQGTATSRQPTDGPAQQRAYQQAAVAWPRDPRGYHFGFGEAKLPARDLAKLGYLYLNGGRWDTTQVVPADYVRASTRPHSHPFGPVGYGYQWWTDTVALHGSFGASGFGGQRIQVVPDLDLVVVITANAAQERFDAGDLVGQTIIPAVTD